MTIRHAALLFSLLLILGCSSSENTSTVDHLAFGSCLKHDKPAPIFEVINQAKPDVFVFVGDNIYGDTHDMQILKYKYFLMGCRPGLQALKKQSQVLATWDDHDYGKNDAGAEYSKKAESQQIFLDTWGEPAGTQRRETEGIHTSYMYGPPEERLQVILLDNRYFRSSLKTGERKEKGGAYVVNTDAGITMLGEAQWKWLEGELKKDAKIRLILGGTQILREHNGYEAWANLPNELEKLVSTIKKTKANGVVFLTGDTHWAELTRRQWDGCYPLFDFTSSGLTEVWKYMSPNKYRFNDMAYLGANFGSVRIDWQKPDPTIALRAIDEKGNVRFTHEIALSTLQF